MPATSVSRKLLAWFGRQNRDLPWRKTRDPYRVWISEVMLAQTTVATAAARYEAFLARFPTVRHLARAREDSVLAAWSGLGYYARARNLRRAARRIVRERGGKLPEEAGELEKLPGIGPYTAAAIAAIAFGRPAVPVDANVARIAARVFATKEPGVFAPRLFSPRRAGESIAALFDLGQTVCRPRDPRCPECPLRAACRARKLKRTGDFPAPRRRPSPRTVHVAVAALERGGRYLVRRRRAGWLSGMWEFPGVEAATAAKARAALRRSFRALPLRPAAELSHTIVGRKLRVAVFRAPAPRLLGGRFLALSEIERGAVPTLTKKIARSLVIES